jgi:hypothetical protein
MPKDDTTEKDDATGGGKDSNAASKMDKQSGGDEGKTSDSSNELEPVRSKKGEPADNLRRRSEWFQKRSGSG